MTSSVLSKVNVSPKALEMGATYNLSRDETSFVCQQIDRSAGNITEAADACRRKLSGKFADSHERLTKAVNALARAMNMN